MGRNNSLDLKPKHVNLHVAPKENSGEFNWLHPVGTQKVCTEFKAKQVVQ